MVNPVGTSSSEAGITSTEARKAMITRSTLR